MKKSFLLCVFFLFSTNFIFAQEQILEETNTETIFQQEDFAAEENYEKITTEQTTKEKSDEIAQITTEEQIEEEIIQDKLPEPAEILQEEIPSHKEFTLGFTDHPEVERFRNLYSSSSWKKKLSSDLEKGLSYRMYIRQALQEQNLPPELEYLPIIESNYKTWAKSKSGALGLWQFMENSVKPFLILNDYVDERLDPWKATDAALKKLTDNYNYFGDWLLAIAAYNCGAGALTRALKKSPEKNFWYLAENKLIPTQTAEYVPKLIAVADLAMNTEFYNIDLPTHSEEFEHLHNEKNAVFDYVTVNAAYSINQLAKAMRLEPETLKELNPAFVKGITHPSLNSSIRLPLGTKQVALDALKKIEPYDFPIKYKVEKGDSLWGISRKHGTTVEALCELNGIKENDILRIGKILYIPSK